MTKPPPQCSDCGDRQDPDMPWIEINPNVIDENGKVWDDVEPHFCSKCDPKISGELLEQWAKGEVCYHCMRQTLCHNCAEMFMNMIDEIYEINQRLEKEHGIR